MYANAVPVIFAIMAVLLASGVAGAGGAPVAPSASPPGGLAPGDTPQMVLITFDDLLSTGRYDLVRQVLTNRWNPNGTPIQATFFLNTDWTDYTLVQRLHAQGHEMAIHTMTHATDTNTTEATWRAEIAGCRRALAQYAGIPAAELAGFRAPYLKFNNASFRILHEQGFAYDASVIESPGTLSSNGASYIWPYTLDAGVAQTCWTGPRPTDVFPGLFEVPMWNLLDGEGAPAFSMDPTGTYESVLSLLQTNFLYRYEGNRAPLGVFLHANWLTNAVHRDALSDFVAWTQAGYSDVWYVSVADAVAFMRDPCDAAGAYTFPPFVAATANVDNAAVYAYSYSTGVVRTTSPEAPLLYPRPDTMYIQRTPFAGGAAEVVRTEQYSTSFWGRVTVSNDTARTAVVWQVSFDIAGGAVHRAVDGTFRQDGARVSVEPATWMRPLLPGEVETNVFGGGRTADVSFANVACVLYDAAPRQPVVAGFTCAATDGVAMAWDDSAYGYGVDFSADPPWTNWASLTNVHGMLSWTGCVPSAASAGVFRVRAIP